MELSKNVTLRWLYVRVSKYTESYIFYIYWAIQTGHVIFGFKFKFCCVQQICLVRNSIALLLKVRTSDPTITVSHTYLCECFKHAPHAPRVQVYHNGVSARQLRSSENDESLAGSKNSGRGTR